MCFHVKRTQGVVQLEKLGFVIKHAHSVSVTLGAIQTHRVYFIFQPIYSYIPG